MPLTPGMAKITPSAPMPKFRSHSFAACSGLILGSVEFLLSTYWKDKGSGKKIVIGLISKELLNFLGNQTEIEKKKERVSTKMKSLPRPWYLTKWRKPLSLQSRKEVHEALSRAWMLLIKDVETQKLGTLRVELELNGWVNE